MSVVLRSTVGSPGSPLVTSRICGTAGDLYEHLEYFPFGETWVSEQTNTRRLPFLFTSKELDEETQFYYFGARYYDPRTSVWQSTDPVLGEILRDIRDPRLLAVYAYTGLNPLRFVDPDGRYWTSPFRAFGRFVRDEVAPRAMGASRLLEAFLRWSWAKVYVTQEPVVWLAIL